MASLVDRLQAERLLLLAAALKSGLIDALAQAEPATAKAVAGSLSADERACYLVLEALTEAGVVEVCGPQAGAPDLGGAGARYQLTETGRRHLLEPGPELERAALVHQAAKLRGWMDLPSVIRYGRCRQENRPERDFDTFARAMAEGDPEPIEEVVDLVMRYAACGQRRSIIDVGGGLGHVALHFARRGLAATVFDVPEIARLARENQEVRAGGVRVVAGDFNVSLPPGPYDIAYLGNVYHIYGEAKNRRLTERVFSMLGPGGTLAVVDYVWGRSPRARMFAVDMLQATDEGGVWTEGEFRDWFTSAGFKDVQVVDLKLRTKQLILGRRA